MFKNKEILLEVDYVKQTCERMESIIRLVFDKESKVEKIIDDIHNILLDLTSNNVLDEFEDLMSSMKRLKESVDECQTMMIKEKENKPIKKEQKKNSTSKTKKKSGTK